MAQTHLAFLKLDNRVVEQIEAAGGGSTGLFQQARKIVIQHYQSIVLRDFVPRIA